MNDISITVCWVCSKCYILDSKICRSEGGTFAEERGDKEKLQSPVAVAVVVGVGGVVVVVVVALTSCAVGGGWEASVLWCF